jgi:hypothetical protein
MAVGTVEGIMAVGTAEGIMAVGTVEGIMVEAIMAADIMVEGITPEGIMVEGIMVEGIMVEDIMPDVVAITEAMPTLTPPMPCMVARLTTGQGTIIGMDATPSALTLLGTIGGIIGITGAGVGPISGAMC